jgi:hypothetical protein
VIVAQDLASAFQETLGLTAIFVAVAAGRTRIGRSTDPTAVHKRLRKIDPDAALLTIGWLTADRAELLTMALRGVLGKDLVAAAVAVRSNSLDAAARRVMAIAEQMGIGLPSDDELRTDAEMMAEHVDHTFNEQLQGGELRAMNRRYKIERMASAAAGRGMISYGRWIESQKLSLIRNTAQATRSSPSARQAIGLAMLPVAAE